MLNKLKFLLCKPVDISNDINYLYTEKHDKLIADLRREEWNNTTCQDDKIPLTKRLNNI